MPGLGRRRGAVGCPGGLLTRRELLISSFDDHIITLRILSRRSTGADTFWDLPTAVNPDWRSMQDWYDSLWLFELLGIKASKYPVVLENGAAAEYATPKKFARRVSSMMLMIPVRNGTSWYHRWRSPVRYVSDDARLGCVVRQGPCRKRRCFR